MNSDIRLHIEFWDHAKTRRMIRVLGLQGPVSLQRLWCYAAKNRPDGVLRGMDAVDIEEAAGWPADRHGEWITYCVKNKWLDRTQERGVYAIHEWSFYNPWAADADARQRDGRFGAHIRYHVQRNSLKPKTCEFCAADREANGVAVGSLKPPYSTGSAPAPQPSPPPQPQPRPSPAPVEEPRERETATARTRKPDGNGNGMTDAAFTARAKEIAAWTKKREPTSEEQFEADFEAEFEMPWSYWQSVKERMEVRH